MPGGKSTILFFYIQREGGLIPSKEMLEFLHQQQSQWWVGGWGCPLLAYIFSQSLSLQMDALGVRMTEGKDLRKDFSLDLMVGRLFGKRSLWRRRQSLSKVEIEWSWFIHFLLLAADHFLAIFPCLEAAGNSMQIGCDLPKVTTIVVLLIFLASEWT